MQLSVKYTLSKSIGCRHSIDSAIELVDILIQTRDL